MPKKPDEQPELVIVEDDPRPRAPRRLIDKRGLLKRVPLSYPTIWNLMRNNQFPRSRKLGHKVVWFEDQIEDMMETLPECTFKDPEVA